MITRRTLSIVGSLLTLAWLLTAFTICAEPLAARQGTGAELPPRPTAEPTPEPVTTVTDSAPSSFIQLQTRFPTTWQWYAQPWYSLHTQVQWQTADGTWIDVKGWYGGHDDIEVAPDGTALATKTWWVASGDYGAGPFRWIVTDVTDSRALATSPAFDLPMRSGQTAVIELRLGD